MTYCSTAQVVTGCNLMLHLRTALRSSLDETQRMPACSQALLDPAGSPQRPWGTALHCTAGAHVLHEHSGQKCTATSRVFHTMGAPRPSWGLQWVRLHHMHMQCIICGRSLARQPHAGTHAPSAAIKTAPVQWRHWPCSNATHKRAQEMHAAHAACPPTVCSIRDPATEPTHAVAWSAPVLERLVSPLGAAHGMVVTMITTSVVTFAAHHLTWGHLERHCGAGRQGIGTWQPLGYMQCTAPGPHTHAVASLQVAHAPA
jgi:hypothetical protein